MKGAEQEEWENKIFEPDPLFVNQESSTHNKCINNAEPSSNHSPR